MRYLRRLWHLLTGHPAACMWWGTLAEGAGCDCGYTFGRWDYP